MELQEKDIFESGSTRVDGDRLYRYDFERNSVAVRVVPVNGLFVMSLFLDVIIQNAFHQFVFLLQQSTFKLEALHEVTVREIKPGTLKHDIHEYLLTIRFHCIMNILEPEDKDSFTIQIFFRT